MSTDPPCECTHPKDAHTAYGCLQENCGCEGYRPAPEEYA